MAKPILNKYIEYAHAKSNPTKPIIDNDINIELSKEYLMELKNYAYHGMFDEDVVDHIAKVLELLDLIKILGVDSHRLQMKEELVEKFFCKLYPESHDGEDEMLDEGDNWGIDPLEFISRVNSSFENHIKVDGRTKKVLFYSWMNGSWIKRRMDNNILSNKEWMEYDYGNSLNTTTNSFFKAHDERDIKEGNTMRQMKHKGDNEMMSNPIKSSSDKEYGKDGKRTRNKKDKRGIVIRNKARLVAQGHTQEEGIYYEEVFALVARIEVIRLFLAYASFMGFMDLKTLIILIRFTKWSKHSMGYIKLLELGELTLFLGLQANQKDDGIFISQDKYVAEILRMFGLTDGKSASIYINTEKPLLNDPDGKDVDVHIYRSMISSLMYLTSFRPDIMFVVCTCARFQVTPKVSHLHAVKKIFKYLKGKPHLGLWYPKDSPFNLVAYSDSDYAGASLDRKFTTGGYQFLSYRLISWQCKKQTVVATSLIEAEYVATASCYA
nr:hypothetical protein [Tanacetum cinerariifolium]